MTFQTPSEREPENRGEINDYFAAVQRMNRIGLPPSPLERSPTMAIFAARKLDVTSDMTPAVTPEPSPTVPPVPVTIFRTQEWMSNPWTIISSIDVPGMTQNDTLRLRTNGTLAIQKSSSGDTETWATWGTECQLTCLGLQGLTMNNLSFSIQFTPTGQVTCTVEDPNLIPDPNPNPSSSSNSNSNSNFKVVPNQHLQIPTMVNGSVAVWVAQDGGGGSNRPWPGPKLPQPSQT
jgi:hypothetical protein